MKRLLSLILTLGMVLCFFVPMPAMADTETPDVSPVPESGTLLITLFSYLDDNGIIADVLFDDGTEKTVAISGFIDPDGNAIDYESADAMAKDALKFTLSEKALGMDGFTLTLGNDVLAASRTSGIYYGKLPAAGALFDFISNDEDSVELVVPSAVRGAKSFPASSSRPVGVTYQNDGVTVKPMADQSSLMFLRKTVDSKVTYTIYTGAANFPTLVNLYVKSMSLIPGGDVGFLIDTMYVDYEPTIDYVGGVRNETTGTTGPEIP